jgi:short-subunit dehydrogenase
MASIALITGATGGLGMEFTRVINSYGDIDEIWAIGRNTEKLETIKSKYQKVVPISADLSADGVCVIKRKIEEEKPNIKLLINNAGIGYLGEYEKMGTEKIQNFCEINCNVPATLISVALPYMHEGAGILNISSASSFQPNPYLALYSASKVFVKNLSRALYMELKPRKITVTAVCPGWIDTDMLPREKDGKKIKYTGIISAEKVVKKALKDNRKGRDMSTPGWFSKYFRVYSKVTPTKITMKQWMKIVEKFV